MGCGSEIPILFEVVAGPLVLVDLPAELVLDLLAELVLDLLAELVLDLVLELRVRILQIVQEDHRSLDD